MRREILGVVLVFVVLFTAVSLLSYHPSDPSINRVGASGNVLNLFGPVGAHVAGFLIFLFGLGAFWIPVFLLIISFYIFKEYTKGLIVVAVVGGLLLTVTTGGLLSMYQSHYAVLGKRFSSGGLVGIPLAKIVVEYSNRTGGLILLLAIWIIAFVMTTRVSLVNMLKSLGRVCTSLFTRATTAWIIWKERRNKAKKLVEASHKLLPRKKGSVKIVAPPKRQVKGVPPRKQEVFEFMTAGRGFRLPSLDLLEDPPGDVKPTDHESLQMQSKLLEKKLSDFDVSGKVVAISPGPVVTMHEYEPAPGVKINKVVNLLDDLAMALRAISIRIVAPIPGKAVIGIEVANANRESVRLKDIIASEAFADSNSKLTLALGKDILGNPVIANLAKMPHLLIAGATGSGKSVALNAMICSILYKATPYEVKLVLIDPKRIELAAYEGIPHMISPVVVDARKATQALQWAVHEMERRYTLMAERGCVTYTSTKKSWPKRRTATNRAKARGIDGRLRPKDRLKISPL
jgi:S-DNA-T family DNA segregation ATPase FtsK/SpoIIIE